MGMKVKTGMRTSHMRAPIATIPQTATKKTKHAALRLANLHGILPSRYVSSARNMHWIYDFPPLFMPSLTILSKHGFVGNAAKNSVRYAFTFFKFRGMLPQATASPLVGNVRNVGV